MDLLQASLAFVIGVIAGFFGSTVGGGGLLSISFLMLIGVPPQVAIATDRFGGVGQAIAAFYRFSKSRIIVWKYVPILCALSFTGSVIGANMLSAIDSVILQKVAAILLVALLPFIWFWPNDIGIVRRRVSSGSIAFSSLAYLLIQTFAGFFGAGTGPFVFYTLMVGFGLTIVEAVATQIIPLLCLSFSSLFVFGFRGLIDYSLGVVLFLGMGAGGYLGAHIALKKGSVWVRRLFALLVIVASIKLLVF